MAIVEGQNGFEIGTKFVMIVGQWNYCMEDVRRQLEDHTLVQLVRLGSKNPLQCWPKLEPNHRTQSGMQSESLITTLLTVAIDFHSIWYFHSLEETIWGWVNTDRIFIFGWTILIKIIFEYESLNVLVLSLSHFCFNNSSMNFTYCVQIDEVFIH